MRLLRRLLVYPRVLRKASRNRSDAVKFLVRRPAIMAAVGAYETAVLVSNRVDIRTKYLAGLRAASLIGCPF